MNFDARNTALSLTGDDLGLGDSAGALRRLPQGSNSLELIVLQSLPRVEERPAALLEVRRVLHPAGRLLLEGAAADDLSSDLLVAGFIPQAGGGAAVWRKAA